MERKVDVQRRLIVMRHAKSSWDSPAAGDHDRPLNDRGRRDAPRVAQRLSEIGWQPQHVLSSDSERTRETCGLMLTEWEAGVDADFSSGLYLAGPQQLEDELQPLSEEIETLLVLGHNPGWEAVVHQLCQQSVPMKTATAALLSTEECPQWSNAFQVSWELHDVIYPRELA